MATIINGYFLFQPGDGVNSTSNIVTAATKVLVYSDLPFVFPMTITDNWSNITQTSNNPSISTCYLDGNGICHPFPVDNSYINAWDHVDSVKVTPTRAACDTVQLLGFQ